MISLPSVSRQSTPWLVLGLLLLYGGQRGIRNAPPLAGQRVLDGALFLLLGLVPLAVWAWCNRTALHTADTGSDISVRERTRALPWPGPAVAAASVLLLVGIWAWFQASVADRLILPGLLVLYLAGLPFHLWRNFWLPALKLPTAREIGTILALTAAAGVIRLLLREPAVPDWDRLAQIRSVAGLLYRWLGAERAILLPFAASCLFPAAMWWGSRQLVPETGALGIGILALLSPFHIWTDLHVTRLVLAPFLVLCFIAAGLKAWQSQHPGTWLWMGLCAGLLWVEVPSLRSLLLVWVPSSILALVLIPAPGTGRPGSVHGLYALLGLVAGPLLFARAPLGLAAAEVWWRQALSGVPSAVQLATLWFQPQSLVLPFHITPFLPLTGVLALCGLILCLWPCNPVLAPAGVCWLAGSVLAVHEGDHFLHLAHAMTAIPLLLAALALAPIMAQLKGQLADWQMPVSDRHLLAGLGLLAVCQMPGGILGENLAQTLANRLRGDITVETRKEAPPHQEAESLFQPLTTLVHDADTGPVWPAALIWQSTGTCTAGKPLLSSPRGIAIDLQQRTVLMVGTDPGSLLILALDEGGRVLGRLEKGLIEPVEIDVAGDGTMRILDAHQNNVLVFEPEAAELRPLVSNTAFFRPRGFHLREDDSMIVADTGQNRIVHLAPDGSIRSHDGNLEQPTDVLERAGRVWVVSPHGNAYVRELGAALEVNVLSASSTLFGPHMAGLPDGSFLLTDPGASRILHLDGDGQLLARVDTGGSVIAPVGIDIAADGDGFLMALADIGTCQVSLWSLPDTVG